MITENQVLGSKAYQVKIMLILSMFLIMVLSTWGIGQNQSIGVWGDEFGYWQSAAFMLGKDWSSIASTNGYYGFGMGFILAPIMYFFHENTVLMYQAALVVEALLLASCVPAAYMCLKNLNLCKNDLFRVLIALVTVIYPSNLIFVRTTMSEILLIFIVWWSFLLAIKYIESGKTGQAIGLVLISIYAYTVHQRALILIIAVIILIIIVSYKNLISKNSITIALILICALTAAALYKKLYIMEFYNETTSELLEINDYSGIKYKIMLAFSSWDGIMQFIYSVLGKIYYLAVSSYGMFLIGLFLCVQKIVQYIKNKMVNLSLPYVFLMLITLFAVGLGALAMGNGFENRMDILMYGRYIEYVIGPLLALGFAFIIEKPLKAVKTTIIVSIITIILIIITSWNIIENAPIFNMWINCGGIGDLFYNRTYSAQSAIILAGKRCLLIQILFVSLLYIRKAKLSVFIALGIIGCLWVNSGLSVWEAGGIKWKEKLYLQQSDIVSVLPEEDVGVYDCYVGAFYQFLLPDKKVEFFSGKESIEMLQKPIAIVTDVTSKESQYIRENYNIVAENERYLLWNYVPDKGKGQ